MLVGGVHGLLSIGFSLAFGVMRIVNFAHGDLVMYGMYVGVVSSTGLGIDPLYAIPFSFLLMALLGAAQYQLVYKRFVGFATLQQLLAAIGLGLVLQMLAQMVFGADTRSAPSVFSAQYFLIGPLFVSAAQVVAFVVAIAATIGVEFLLIGTRWGKTVRAVADDIEAAEKDRRTQQIIRQRGGAAEISTDSVAEWTSAHRIIQAARDHFGRIDAVVNNAGILRDGIFHRMSADDWLAVISVYLNGRFFVSRAAAEHFRKQESGAFVHITSTSGLIGNVGGVYRRTRRGEWRRQVPSRSGRAMSRCSGATSSTRLPNRSESCRWRCMSMTATSWRTQGEATGMRRF